MKEKRICRKCKKEKFLVEFDVRERFEDGYIKYRWQCSECQKVYRKTRYQQGDKAKLAREHKEQKKLDALAEEKICNF